MGDTQQVPEENADDAAANRWRAVAAALADGRRLNLYARIITAAQAGIGLQPEGLDRAEAKSYAALAKAGLVVAGPAGLAPVPEVFAELLAAGRTPRDTTALRFLSGGRAALPSRRADRLELLHHLAGLVFERHGGRAAGTVPATGRAELTEAEVTGRLAKYCADPALVRRALVDEGIVARSPDGSCYWLTRPRPADGMEFART